jgi:hypothetical protein
LKKDDAESDEAEIEVDSSDDPTARAEFEFPEDITYPR